MHGHRILNIHVEQDPHFRVLTLKGRLDLISASTFAVTVYHEIASGARQVLVDCTELELVSSAGVGELVTAGKVLAAAGGSLAFTAPPKPVLKVFDTVGFPRLYTFYESRDAAHLAASQVIRNG